MKKIYSQPILTIEIMNLPLLGNATNIPVGGTGTLDSKTNNQYFEDEDVEE
jgi:hypothetical protein